MADATFDPHVLSDMNNWARQQQRLMEEQRRATMTSFQRGITETVSGLKALHGSTQHSTDALQKFAKFAGLGAFSGAITAAITSLTTMTQTYAKLSDIGQMFNGSMFDMQKQAGASGLTLEEFASSVSKGSLVIARMSADQTVGTKTFLAYQKGVRDNLKQFGYFGMTLSDVTDVTSEYAETLRTTGQWGKMSNQQRQSATVEFVKNIQGLVELTGKSRAELMKQTMQTVSEPDFAGALAKLQPEQAARMMEAYTALAAELGPKGGEAFKQLIVNQGNSWVEGSLTRQFIDTGHGDIAAKFQKMRDDVLRGTKAASMEFQKSITDVADTIGSDESLSGMNQLVGKLKPTADSLLSLQQAHLGIQADKKRQREMDDTSKAIITFKTNLNALTGSFRAGFYDGIVSSMLKGAGSLKNFDDSMAKMQETFEGFGKVAGTFFSLIVDVIPALVEAFKLLTGAMGFVQKVIEGILTKFGLGETRVDKKDEQGKQIYEKDAQGNDTTVKATTVESNHAKTIASFLTVIGAVGGIFLLKKIITGSYKVMTLNAGIVNVNTGRRGAGLEEHNSGATKRRRSPAGQHELDFEGKGKGKGGRLDAIKRKLGFSSLGDAVGNGVASSVTGEVAKKGRMARLFGAGSGFRSVVGKGLVGLALGGIANTVMDELPSFSGKSYVDAVVTGASMGGMFGLPGLIVGAVGGLIFQSFQDAEKRMANPGTYAADSPLWSGIPKEDQLKYQNSPASRKASGDDQFNPNEYTWWNPGSWRNQKPAGAAVGAPGAATPPPDDSLAIEMFKAQMLSISPALRPDIGNPLQAANSDDLYKALTVMTPAMMGDAMKFVSDVHNRDFLTAPTKDTDKFEVLQERLVDIEALVALDKQKIAQGDTTKQDELAASIVKSNELIAALLNRGIAQREDQGRRAANAARTAAMQ